MSPREPGFYPDIPNAEYHKGLITDPRPLSSTLAKNLLKTLPAEAKYALENGEHKTVYDEGTALHELILEGGFKTVVELDFDSFRTKAAQEAREDARLAGLTPMLGHKLDWIKDAAHKTLADPEVQALLQQDPDESHLHVEVSALAEVMGVPAQARYDYLRLPEDGKPGYVVDLKTVGQSAAPDDFNRNAATYGYHIQAAFYLMVLEALGYDREQVPDYYWLVVSKQEPYAHSLIKASQVDLLSGRVMAEAAIEKYRQILKHGWPTTTTIAESSFPAWVHFEAQDMEETQDG